MECASGAHFIAFEAAEIAATEIAEDTDTPRSHGVAETHGEDSVDSNDMVRRRREAARAGQADAEMNATDRHALISASARPVRMGRLRRPAVEPQCGASVRLRASASPC